MRKPTLVAQLPVPSAPGGSGSPLHQESTAQINARPYRSKFAPSTHPSFAQALSALVKTIRLRRVHEAIYWLIYLDSFTDDKVKGARFRVACRILIGSCEDGMSVTVMEQVVSKFRQLVNRDTDLSALGAEVVRICKIPNWWEEQTGGPDYILSGFLGRRRAVIESGERDPAALMERLREAIARHDKAGAVGAVLTLTGAADDANPHAHCPAVLGTTKVANLLLSVALDRNCELAGRLAEVHLHAKGALSGDNNFLGMAAWVLGGGVSPLADATEPVEPSEVTLLMEAARRNWENPQPIPTWCCDGIHCAGNDRRFAGLWREMLAVCRAKAYYGRLDPELPWKEEFYRVDSAPESLT